ncbi:MAG: J domain-containing protein [Desulfobacterales bacterium]
MYLASVIDGGRRQFYIRQSYPDGESYLHRDLFKLGPAPGRFIVYPGGNSFYVDEAVEDAIRDHGIETSQEDLESIFWPFVDPEIRRKLEPFRRQERRLKEEREVKQAPHPESLHLFDKRRIHFLKFGQMEQRSLDRLPASAVRQLQAKSRDEIEQSFMQMETVLRPREIKAYCYVIFNLQQFFTQRFAKDTPEFLDPDEVDRCFVEELCALDADASFWPGVPAAGRLHDYLVRYVLMFFDHDYGSRSLAEEYLRDFMNRHREHRPPESVAVGLEEAGRIFGKSREALKRLTRRDLGRLYRRRAQELHPDKGGSHETFLRLTAAYHRLLRTKK